MNLQLAKKTIAFYWNGRLCKGCAGDSITSALWRNGIVTMGFSRKRHRPLGVSGSFLQGELVQVDGQCHVRASTTPIFDGMHISQQNVWPSVRFNVLALMRYIPANWLSGGFERTRLFPGGTRRFQYWERLLMFLAGEVSLDSRNPSSAPVIEGRRLFVDTAVVGGGISGRHAANEAARAGDRTVLISSSLAPGWMSIELGLTLADLDDRVTVLLRHQVVGLYRGGSHLLAVPINGAEAATVVVARRIVLATGKWSCAPLVPGNDLPGVMDAHQGMTLARDLGKYFGPVIVVGTGAETSVSAALQARGVQVVETADVHRLGAIRGQNRVAGAVIDGRYRPCRALVHAGPWLTNPSLGFQACASGALRLTVGKLPDNVTVVGSANEPDEPVMVCDSGEFMNVAVCPCMDVMAGEIYKRALSGETSMEVLKRATGCGMGPCQGFPCWSLAQAVVRRARPETVLDYPPTPRPPRGGITVRQAAGLDGLVDLE